MRKRRSEQIPEPSRFDRFGQSDLINMLESTMMRNAELFRGLSHSELDQRWVLSELETQAQMALGAVQALRRKVEVQTF